jgi:hypothetical protein
MRESSGISTKINWEDRNGPAYGLLQYHRDTFKEQCVDRFGFVDDIMDPEIQRACAALMLDDEQEWRWPTIIYCL